jgi:hypothetical protein
MRIHLRRNDEGSLGDVDFAELADRRWTCHHDQMNLINAGTVLALNSAAIIAAAALCSGIADEVEKPQGAWYSIVTESGTQIGHASQEILPVPGGRQITASQEIDIEEEVPPAERLTATDAPKSDRMSWRTVTTEDISRRPTSIIAESQIGPEWDHNVTNTTVQIAGGKANIVRRTPAETRSFSIDLPPGVRFDDGEELLRQWNPGATPRLEFQNFNVDAMAVERVVIEAIPGAVPDAQGRRAVLRERYDGSSLMAAARLLLDRDGHIAQVTQPMFGTSLTIRVTDRQTALSATTPYRMLRSSMSKSPYLIGVSALHGHIRYRFSFRDGIDFAIPETGEQRVTTGPGFATVDICDTCGPGLASDAASIASARAATPWLQSDHPEIRAIADPIAKIDISDARKMELLREKARPYLGKVDFVGHYTALETISRRASDCTDAAVLLAALGRAAGIPTKVANGLVYSRESYHGVADVFMPHSWTLAFVDGRWRSFDLALGDFDSTHIALTVGDGDERSLSAASQLAGLLRWDAMAEVRTQTAK